MADSYDIYLVLHQVRDNLAGYRSMVGTLDRLERSFLAGAELFYRPSADIALLVLHFSPYALMHLGEDSIHLLAHRTRLPMIVPSRLDDDRRRQFFLDGLSRYEIYLPPSGGGHGDGRFAPATRVLDDLAERLESLPAPHDEYPAGDQELPLFQPRWQRAPSTGADMHSA
ncbi:hypothetical protein [Haliangium sp.]|uniref:hypothetical protein n=1 Tax=Haliangium sp. TaxID=2663208 RepID=UPI003D13FF2E